MIYSFYSKIDIYFTVAALKKKKEKGRKRKKRKKLFFCCVCNVCPCHKTNKKTRRNMKGE